MLILVAKLWFVVLFAVVYVVAVAVVVIAVEDVAVVQVLGEVALVADDVVLQVAVRVKGQALFDDVPLALSVSVVVVFAFVVVLDVAVVQAVSVDVVLVVALVPDVGLQVVVDVVALQFDVLLRFAFVAVAHHVDERPLAVGVAAAGPLLPFAVEPL